MTQSLIHRPILSAPRTIVALCLCMLLSGCVQPEFNKTPTTGESDCLSDVRQVTHGFDRAGEGYFSHDMQWIVFQASPHGQQQYQMYVAQVVYTLIEKPLPPGTIVRATPLPGPITIPTKSDEIEAIGQPIRVSPENSRNTCGYFSPDGNSLLFASTANKEKPDEPTSGYQRQGGNYRWSYPEGMELFRADGWQSAIAAAEPGKIVDLARHPLTDNNAYDAEGSYSSNGKWICFTSKMTGDLELYAMRPDGTGLVQLTHTPGYDGGPFFSPDGKRLLYRSDRNKNDLLQVFVADIVYDRAGNITGLINEQQLTHDANVNWGPFWHPDGKHIVYATSIHGHANYEIYLMRADGSHKTRVTFKAGADVLPVFSPDGRYLMWTSKRTTDNTTQIFLAKFKMPKGT